VTEWFYADGQQQLGPVGAGVVVDLFQSRQIRADTLVWREGMTVWQPLSSVFDELGLAPLPPRMPPSLPADPAPTAHAQAPAGPGTPTLPPRAPTDVSMPPRRGLSGCALVAVIGACALVVLVPIGAILAAIAMPAYNDYVNRAKVSQAIVTLEPLKQQVGEFVAREGRCPTGADAGFPDRDGLAAEGWSSVQLGRFDSGGCGIEATLSTGKESVDGDLLWLEFDPDASHWQCSGEIADKFLPTHCRG